MSDDDETTAVLLIAHGSRRQAANEELRGLASRVRALGPYRIVEASFLELAEPDIPEGAARCVAQGATLIVMIPYFLSMGIHLTRDLTNARAELASQYEDVHFTLGSPLGPHPLLDQLVLKRIEETTKKRT